MHFARRDAGGRWAAWSAVIFYMDAGGIRPIVIEMAQRFSSASDVVLLPNLFSHYV